VSANCHAHDEYDVPNDVYSERHGLHPQKTIFARYLCRARSLCTQAHAAARRMVKALQHAAWGRETDDAYRTRRP
jgi:hypothetical protein